MDEFILGAAADFVAPFEGFKANSYVCPGGVLTFGYGSLVKNYPQIKFPVTKDEAKKCLMTDLKSALFAVDRLVEVPLNANQTVALVSFVYNVGETAFAQSTLLQLLNQGKYAEAADQLPRWNKAGKQILKGLILRREAEKELFLTPMENKKVSDPINPDHYQAQGIQAIDMLRQQLSAEAFAGYLRGNIFKYVFRAGKKGQKADWLIDLSKAQWYIDQLKAELEKI